MGESTDTIPAAADIDTAWMTRALRDAGVVVEQTERGDEMFAVMAERHAIQIRGVGLLDLL